MIDVEAIRKRAESQRRTFGVGGAGHGTVAELCDEITRLQALVEWRTDWENAPRDGTWLFGGYYDQDGCWITVGMISWSKHTHQWLWYRHDAGWFNFPDDVEKPTHYRLITPPTADEPKEQL